MIICSKIVYFSTSFLVKIVSFYSCGPISKLSRTKKGVKGSVILRTTTLSREINDGIVFNRFKAELTLLTANNQSLALC
jgi:hypothetical protein